MSRLDPLLDHIDRTLAECDARQLPPLDTEPVDQQDRPILDAAPATPSKLAEVVRRLALKWQRR